jgi:predicted enzyme related to lactoylglutathione lyase
MAKRFFWYELMTTDVDAAKRFYGDVIGWQMHGFPGAEDYTVIHAGDRGIGGIMSVPDGMAPLWMGYVHVTDADAATAAIASGGGEIHRPASDIPNVGRFSVVADDQGAVFNLLRPDGPDQPAMAQDAVGGVGWHELYTGNIDKALAFYGRQFGWTASQRMEMGEMGAYQLFSVEGADNGGIMKNPMPGAPNMWVFYFTVPALDRAVAAITAGGGSIMMGPMEVPGGSWIAMATDPQSAIFAVTAKAR